MFSVCHANPLGVIKSIDARELALLDFTIHKCRVLYWGIWKAIDIFNAIIYKIEDASWKNNVDF